MFFQAIRYRFQYFREHSFIKNVAFLQVAGMMGSIAQAMIGIFIARILQPELYGVYAVAFGLAALIFISTGVQETITIVLTEAYIKKDRETVVRALGFFLRFTLIFGVLTLVASALLPMIGRIFYHDPTVGFYAAIVVYASILSSFAFSIAVTAFQATGDIKKMALLTFFDQLLRFSLSLGLVAAGYGILGAAMGHLIGALIICAISIILWSSFSRRSELFPSLRELVRTARHARGTGYLSLSLWVTIDKNIAMLYSILPVLLAGIYLSRSEVSYFKLAFGFVTLALSLLGPISTLLNSELSRMKVSDPERMAKNFFRVSCYAIGVSTFLTIGVIVAAPFVFHLLYGPGYEPTVKYISGFMVYGVFFGIGVALGPMWRVVNRVKTSIAINLIVLGCGVPSGLYLIRHFGIWGGVIMITLWFTVSHLVSFAYLMRYLKNQNKRLHPSLF